MEISRHSFFVLFIVIAFTSCIDKQQNSNNKSVVKPIISEYKSCLDDYMNEEKKPYHYTLYVKKIIYPEKTIYVYKEKREDYYADSLVLYIDSVQMNNEKLLFLNKKLIFFKGKNVTVKKYQYLDRSSNLFIVDSLGLVIQHAQTHPNGTVTREYNSDVYHDFCNIIIKDSMFYRFEFDLKHLKEFYLLKNKNSR